MKEYSDDYCASCEYVNFSVVFLQSGVLSWFLWSPLSWSQSCELSFLRYGSALLGGCYLSKVVHDIRRNDVCCWMETCWIHSRHSIVLSPTLLFHSVNCLIWIPVHLAVVPRGDSWGHACTRVAARSAMHLSFSSIISLCAVFCLFDSSPDGWITFSLCIRWLTCDMIDLKPFCTCYQ